MKSALFAASIFFVFGSAAGFAQTPPQTGATGGAKAQFELLSARFEPERVDAVSGRHFILTLVETFKSEGASPDFATVFVIVPKPKPQEWHFAGPGFGTVSGIAIPAIPGFFPPHMVFKKYPPSTKIRVMEIPNPPPPKNVITVCFTPDGEVIVFCQLGAEQYYRRPALGRPIQVEKTWIKIVPWPRTALPPQIPRQISMPSVEALRHAVSGPVDIELVGGLTPAMLGLSQEELNSLIAKEMAISPANIQIPERFPKAIEIPSRVGQPGPRTVTAVVCGFIFNGDGRSDCKDASVVEEVR
jgi:hypothetical protein